MYKELTFDQDGKIMLLRGAYKLFKAVSTTFSPSGCNVMMELYGNQIQNTKDGVTVAKQVKVENPLENMAIECIKEIALRTVERVGDGTTSSILLAYFILKQGLIGDTQLDIISMPDSELTPDVLKTELKELRAKNVFRKFTKKDLSDLKKASKFLVDLFNEKTIKIDDPSIYKHVAYISSNGDEEIAEMIKDAMAAIGNNGNILVETTNTNETRMEICDGLLVEKGFVSSFFANVPNKMISELKNPYVLISRDKIWSSKQVGHVLELINAESINLNMPRRPVLFIAPEIKDGALDVLITNQTQGTFQICAVEVSGTPEYLDDLIIDLSKVCGGIPLSSKFTKHLGTGSSSVTLADLGQVELSNISKNKMILVPKAEHKSNMEEHITYLKNLLESGTADQDRPYISERISRLSDKIATLTIGGLTRQSMSERYDRIEDAICACYAARENGVLPGGLVSYAYALNKLSQLPQNNGVHILSKAILDLITLLYKEEGETTYNTVLNGNKTEEDPKKFIGIDLNDGEQVGMFEKGILDPTNVLIETVQNAVEISSLIIFSNCFITRSNKLDLTPPDPMDALKAQAFLRKNFRDQ